MVHLLGAGIWVGRPPAARAPSVRGQPTTRPLLIPTRCGPCSAFPASRSSRCSSLSVRVSRAPGCWSEASPAWWGRTHGHLLLAKIAVLVSALLLAAASRAVLPALSRPAAKPSATARRMAVFIAIEAGLVLVAARPRYGDDGDHARASTMILYGPGLSDSRSTTCLKFRLLQRLVQPPIEFVLVGSGLTLLAIVFLIAAGDPSFCSGHFSSWLQAAPRSAFSP